jgi:hypothetical protein
MTWHPPVPRRVTDAAGTAWTVQRAWPGTSPGSYVLEVRSPERPGVLAGHFNGGAFAAITVDDPRLPALAAESARGEIVVHRAHKRAVLRAPEAYIKVFRTGRALAAAASHNIAAAALTEGGFNTPRLVSAGPDVLVFSRLAGRSFHELGHSHAGSTDQSGIAGQAGIRSQTGITDASYAALWTRWSRAWVGTVTAAGSSAFQDSLQQLPLRDAGKEAASLQRWVDHWLRHSEGHRRSRSRPRRAPLPCPSGHRDPAQHSPGPCGLDPRRSARQADAWGTDTRRRGIRGPRAPWPWPLQQSRRAVRSSRIAGF